MKIEKNFVEDKNARSKAFYAMSKSLCVDSEMLDELYRWSIELGKANIRLCLHPGSSDAFHQMVILEWKGQSFPAHRHPTKCESYHMIRGSMDVLIFEPNGGLRSKTRIDEDSPIMRIGPDDFHCVELVSSFAIYHEVKPGPFVRETDKVMAAWLKS